LDDEHRSIHFFADDLVKALDTLAAGELQVGAGLHRIDRPEGGRSRCGKRSTHAAAEAGSGQRQHQHQPAEMAHGGGTPCLGSELGHLARSTSST
jgi:hypothetical protein